MSAAIIWLFFFLPLVSILFLPSLLLTSFPLLHERLTYVPSGTAIVRFPWTVVSPSFGLSFVLSLSFTPILELCRLL